MTDQQIKEMFSKEILGHTPEDWCLRRVLFSERNKINWQDAYRMALYEMPELKNYKAN